MPIPRHLAAFYFSVQALLRQQFLLHNSPFGAVGGPFCHTVISIWFPSKAEMQLS